MPDHLFVYGTLRLGQGANPMLGTSEYVGTFEYQGASMASLGGFPGIRLDGQGSIVGDLYKIADPSIINRCDSYEGYHERDPDGSLYLRKEIEVNGVPAFIYEYNGSLDQREAIPGGDWVRRYVA